MEAKTIFKLKDVVYVTSFGWGIVIDAGCSTPDGWVGVETNSGRIIHVDTYLVSFTEYTLEGFSQERPEELPKKGDIVWTRAEFPSQWEIGHFFEKKGNEYRTYLSPSFQGWNNKGIEIRTTNPYEDEHTKEDEETIEKL